jgi:accessory gene regulator protein AgrB
MNCRFWNENGRAFPFSIVSTRMYLGSLLMFVVLYYFAFVLEGSDAALVSSFIVLPLAVLFHFVAFCIWALFRPRLYSRYRRRYRT